MGVEVGKLRHHVTEILGAPGLEVPLLRLHLNRLRDVPVILYNQYPIHTNPPR